MNTAHRKCVLLIVDGLGDLPVAELGDQTPLEAARTPVLNRLATLGHYGLIDPIGPDDIPNTHSGTSLLFGLRPEQLGLLKRGPVEAFGAGRSLKNGEIALRSNFASVEEVDGELYVIDRRAGRITDGTTELANVLGEVDLGDGVTASLLSTDQHRGVVVLSGPGLNEAIADTDPGDLSLPARLVPCQALRQEAEFTAGKIDLLIAESHRRLRDHSLNAERVAAGKYPANCLITRGAGVGFSLDNLLTEHQISAALVAGCNTVKGLARMFDYETISDPRFTAAFDTDLPAKISAVLGALESVDIVYLHVKAPDICSHDRQPGAKRDFLERLDQALGVLASSGLVIALAADHTTDSNTGFHTADPVPGLLYDPLAHQQNGPVNFGESACRNGNMERQTSYRFLQRVIATMAYSNQTQ